MTNSLVNYYYARVSVCVCVCVCVCACGVCVCTSLDQHAFHSSGALHKIMIIESGITANHLQDSMCTIYTCERLKMNISVSFHMTVEISTLRESSITDMAAVGLFSRVSPEMLGEGGAVRKRFTA